MNTTPQSGGKHSNTALWVTVIVEALVIVAIGAYNIYEIRRKSELVQAKIEKLSVFSAKQGEKVDRMMTALELYIGKKIEPAATLSTNATVSEERIDKAIEFLQTLKKKD